MQAALIHRLFAFSISPDLQRRPLHLPAGARVRSCRTHQHSVFLRVRACPQTSDLSKHELQPNRFAPGDSVRSVISVLEGQRSLFDSEER
jgi:hypothetical protein